MKAQIVPLALLMAAAIVTRGEETPGSLSTSPSMKWNTDPAYWDKVLTQKAAGGLKLGKSDFVLGGPIVDGLRRRPADPNRGFGQKFLGFPVVRWFVPLKTPGPPGGGKYFRWGESEQAWASIAGGAAAASSSGNPVTHESSASLISVSR